MSKDKTYSDKDFTGHNLQDRKNMSGLLIVNSCFSQEIPDTVVFPADMTGTTFEDCNLDNVFIPPGNTVKRGTTKRFKVQNDGEDWLVDSHDKPLEPLSKVIYQRLGLSIDPVDLPPDKAEISLITQTKIDLAQVKFDAIKAIEDAP